MKRVRTFVAIDPGQRIRARLEALQESFMREGVRAKWVAPDNLHVTLLFLGEVDYNTVPKICSTIQEVVDDHAGFPMAIGETGCFPNPRRPRVLWVGVKDGADQVCLLHDDLEGPLMDIGCYRREERKYTPHITLGRITGDRRRPAMDISAILNDQSSWLGGEVAVNEILVMSSELMSKGPEYTVLSRAKLG